MATASPRSIEQPKSPDAQTGPADAGHNARRAADTAMVEYVGYLASWFDIGQLAAGFRARREHAAPQHRDA